jgi:hypothetical protein
MTQKFQLLFAYTHTRSLCFTNLCSFVYPRDESILIAVPGPIGTLEYCIRLA